MVTPAKDFVLKSRPKNFGLGREIPRSATGLIYHWLTFPLVILTVLLLKSGKQSLVADKTARIIAQFL